MTRDKLFEKIDSTWLSAKRKQELKTAVDKYTSAILQQCNVSRSLPSVDEIAEAASNYLGLNNGMTYDDLIASGHWVAGATWGIERAGRQ